MRIAIVTSRLCDSGDQLALRRFVCCEPNGPEYAMDVQRYIRGLRVKDEPGMYRMVLQYGETPNAPIVGFEVQWLDKDGSSSDGPLTTIVPFNNIESIEQVETVEAEDGGLK